MYLLDCGIMFYQMKVLSRITEPDCFLRQTICGNKSFPDKDGIGCFKYIYPGSFKDGA